VAIQESALGFARATVKNHRSLFVEGPRLARNGDRSTGEGLLLLLIGVAVEKLFLGNLND
jgi:hypothetical protein